MSSKICESSHNFKKLSAHIVGLSEADNFDDAKSEWKLDRVCFTKGLDRCPCGVKIIEHCYLKNDKNGKTTWVGNVCVRKFMEIDAGKLFSALRNVRKNPSAKPNTALIEYAWKRGYLYSKSEYEFLTSIHKKRKSSEKQVQWLRKINRRIIGTIVVNKIPDQIDIADDIADDGDGDGDGDGDHDGDGEDDDTKPEFEGIKFEELEF